MLLKIKSIKIQMVFFYLICFMPLFPYLFLQYKYGVNVPFWDDWEMVDLYRMWITNDRLFFAALWAPHNEHRILVANLIGLGLARISDFNTLVPMYLSTVVKILIVILIWKLLKITLRSSDTVLLSGFSLLASILMFSIHDGELLIWGIPSLYWNIYLFFQILMFYELTIHVDDWLGVLIASIAVMICSLIISNGLVLIIIGGIQMMVSNLLCGRQLFNWKLTYWIIIMAVFLTIYFYDYHPSGDQDLGSFIVWALSHLGNVGRFFLTYMASIMIFYPRWIIGGVGILLLVFLTFYFSRFHPEKFKELLPWYLIAFNVVLDAMLTTYGRVKFGAGVANSSRYMALSRFFWFGLFVILTVAYNQHFEKRTSINFRKIGTIMILLVLFLLPITISNNNAYLILKPHWARFSNGLEYLYQYETSSDKELENLYPSVPRLRNLIRFLDEYNLGPFASRYRLSPNERGNKK